MPNYPWLQKRELDPDTMTRRLQALRMLGVPYSDQDIQAVAAQVQGKTEMDATVAYMQVLGTMAKLDYGVAYRE